MNIFPYILGSIITIVILFIVSRFVRRTDERVVVRYSQSYMYSMMKPFIDMKKEKPFVKTQTSEFERKQYIPVIIIDGQAYWILNNTLFTADQVDGVVDKETSRPVDTMAMDSVQLKKTVFIVDALTEGLENDNWGSGHEVL